MIIDIQRSLSTKTHSMEAVESIAFDSNLAINLTNQATSRPYRNADGKYADFHALRHTFNTRAWTTGTTPDVARALARHSDINLTLRDTHTTQAAQADAIQKMPSLPMAGN